MNRQVAGNLDKIITALEADEPPGWPTVPPASVIVSRRQVGPQSVVGPGALSRSSGGPSRRSATPPLRTPELTRWLLARLLWRWALTITVYNPIVEGLITSHGEFRPGDPRSAINTRVRYGLALDVPVVLFVGRLVPKKGFHTLIEARSPDNT